MLVMTDDLLALTKANLETMRQESALALDLRRVAQVRGDRAPPVGMLRQAPPMAPTRPPPMEPARYYLLKRATDQATALSILKTRTCACVRKSFAGICWREGAEERRLTWAEVDGA